ncbi:MAG: putative transcriptional regulator [Paraglaciecola sp.]|jgi:putative transcriptional regulator
MSKRDLFAELSSALVEAKEHSEGKLTLKTYQVNDVGELKISPDEIISIREKLKTRS